MKRERSFQVEEIQQEWICAITRMGMTDPVITEDGHSYERQYIEKWLKKKKTSPKTGLKLKSIKVVPNIVLKSLIEKFNHSYKHDIQKIVQQNKDLKLKLSQVKRKLQSIRRISKKKNQIIVPPKQEEINNLFGSKYDKSNQQQEKLQANNNEKEKDKSQKQIQETDGQYCDNNSDDQQNDEEYTNLENQNLELKRKMKLQEEIFKKIAQLHQEDKLKLIQVSKHHEQVISQLNKANQLLKVKALQAETNIKSKESQIRQLKQTISQGIADKIFLKNRNLKLQDQLDNKEKQIRIFQAEKVNKIFMKICQEEKATIGQNSEEEEIKSQNHPQCQKTQQNVQQKLEKRILLVKTQKIKSSQRLKKLAQKRQQRIHKKAQNKKIQQEKPANFSIKTELIKQQQYPVDQIPMQKYFIDHPVIYYDSVNRLDHSEQPINLQKFLKHDWRELKILNLSDCKLTSKQFEILLKNGNHFPNLCYLQIWKNKIINIPENGLESFKKLVSISFAFKNKFKNPLNQKSIKYLDALKQSKGQKISISR